MNNGIKKLYTTNEYDYDTGKWRIEYIFMELEDGTLVREEYDPKKHETVVADFLRKNSINPDANNCIIEAVEKGLLERLDVEDIKNVEIEKRYYAQQLQGSQRVVANDAAKVIQMAPPVQKVEKKEQEDSVTNLARGAVLAQLAYQIQLMNPDAEIRITDYENDLNIKLFSSVPVEQLRLPRSVGYDKEKGFIFKNNPSFDKYGLTADTLDKVGNTKLMPPFTNARAAGKKAQSAKSGVAPKDVDTPTVIPSAPVAPTASNETVQQEKATAIDDDGAIEPEYTVPGMTITSPKGRQVSGKVPEVVEDSEITPSMVSRVEGKAKGKGKFSKKLKRILKAIGIGILGVTLLGGAAGVVAGLGYYGASRIIDHIRDNKKDTPVVNVQDDGTISVDEAIRDTIIDPTMTYQDAISKLKPGVQRDTFVLAYNFLTQANDLTRVDGNFYLERDGENYLNFTVEEVVATIAVVNNYSPAQLAELYNGENVDATSLIADYQNFYHKIDVYYMNAVEPLPVSSLIADEEDRAFYQRMEDAVLTVNKSYRENGELATSVSDQYISEIYEHYVRQGEKSDRGIDPAVAHLASAPLSAYMKAYRNVPTSFEVQNATGNVERGDSLQTIVSDVAARGAKLAGEETDEQILDIVNGKGYCEDVSKRVTDAVSSMHNINTLQARQDLVEALNASGRYDLAVKLTTSDYSDSVLDEIATIPAFADDIESYRQMETSGSNEKYPTFDEMENVINEWTENSNTVPDLAAMVNLRTVNFYGYDFNAAYGFGLGEGESARTTTTTRTEEVDYDDLTAEEQAQVDNQRAEIEADFAEQNETARDTIKINEAEHSAGLGVAEGLGEGSGVRVETDAITGQQEVVVTDAVSGQDMAISSDVADVIFQTQVNGGDVEAVKDAAVEELVSQGFSEELAEQRVEEISQVTGAEAVEERENREALYEQALREAAELNAQQTNSDQAEAAAWEAAHAEEEALIAASTSEGLGEGSGDATETPDNEVDTPSAPEVETPTQQPVYDPNLEDTMADEEIIVQPASESVETASNYASASPEVQQRAIEEVVAEMTSGVDLEAEEITRDMGYAKTL